MEKLHMQYDTIMGMLFYEFQNVLETYSNILEERREAEEKEKAFKANAEAVDGENA